MERQLGAFCTDDHLASIRATMEKVSECLEEYRQEEEESRRHTRSNVKRSKSYAHEGQRRRTLVSAAAASERDGKRRNVRFTTTQQAENADGNSSEDDMANLKKELTSAPRYKVKSRLDWDRSPFVFSIKQQDIETIYEEPAATVSANLPNGGSKRSSSSDGSVDNEYPPSLNTRHRKGSEGDRKQRGHRGKHRASLPAVIGDSQMVCSRTPPTPSKSHTLSALKKRYKSTSSIPVSYSYNGPQTHVANMLEHRELSPVSPASTSTSSDLGTFGDNSDSPHGSTSSETLPGSRHFFHSVSMPNPQSPCADLLDKVDIVGESYEARFPWQRDVSTQCNISWLQRRRTGSSGSGNAVSSGNADTQESRNDSAALSKSDGLLRRKIAFKHNRPHSIGCMENVLQEAEMKLIREQNGRRPRNSEPYIQHPSLLHKKRMPLLVMDDPGSVSDLESILESPVEGTVDASRNNSLVDDEDSRFGDELSQIGGGEETQDDGYTGVLPSPRMSPDIWKSGSVPDVVVNTDAMSNSEKRQQLLVNGNNNYLSVPRKSHRSGSLTSGSEESDCEPSPPVARRGRRAAIVDTKNFGDVSPTTLSPEVSPSNSCDEGDGASNIAGRLRRRRSSVDLAMNIYPGDLLVQEHHKKLIKRNTISDFYAGRNGSSPALSDESKKARQSFSLLKLMKTRSKDSLTQLGEILAKMKASEFKDNHLAAYKNTHWSDLTTKSERPEATDSISEGERKRRESVWELFKSECVFLIDHLMVLKHCFQEPLKRVQVEGSLMYAEPSDIFSNLDELCYVSYTFCKDFISGLVKDLEESAFGATSILIKALKRFSTHSKDGGVYHTYCLNYSNALNYLEKLRKNDDFCEFEKWCEQDARCNRLQLADLLICPMQHCTKLPLLLNNIKKYTRDPGEKQQIEDSIHQVETSLQQLEQKMMWLKNFERVQAIQRRLVWPVVTELDTRAFVPEFLKEKVLHQPCKRLLACPSRQLIHEGPVTLTESTKSHDAYMFLFDDILLVTKIKKTTKKKQSSSDQSSQSGQPDSATYIVHRQPIALDRFGLHDVCPSEAAANGLKFSFVLVQISRFQQIIDVFTLQAASDHVKQSWITHIQEAKNKYNSQLLSRENSLKEDTERDRQKTNSSEMNTQSHSRRSSGASMKKGQPGKSASIDAVFL